MLWASVESTSNQRDETSIAAAAAAADDDVVCLCVTSADGRLLWYGVAMGALVGILLIVVDEAVTTQPLIPV